LDEEPNVIMPQEVLKGNQLICNELKDAVSAKHAKLKAAIGCDYSVSIVTICAARAVQSASCPTTACDWLAIMQLYQSMSGFPK